jgi:hypothetical protein
MLHVALLYPGLPCRFLLHLMQQQILLQYKVLRRSIKLALTVPAGCSARSQHPSMQAFCYRCPCCSRSMLSAGFRTDGWIRELFSIFIACCCLWLHDHPCSGSNMKLHTRRDVFAIQP